MKNQPTAQQFIDIADNCWNDTEIAQWYTNLMRKLNPKPKGLNKIKGYGRSY